MTVGAFFRIGAWIVGGAAIVAFWSFVAWLAWLLANYLVPQ